MNLLGKAPKKENKHIFKLAKYTVNLAAAPEATDRTASITGLGMMANDRVGCCTCSGAAHIIQAWTAEAGDQFIVSDADVLAGYSAVTGYDPTDPSTDNGAACTDVLTYWKHNGFAGHRIGASLDISPTTEGEVEKGLYYFGAVYLGVALPANAQGQDAWNVIDGDGGEPGSWGGHCVPIVAYDAQGVTVITWGKFLKVSWDFLRKYCDEAYVALSRDIIAGNGKSPEGFAIEELQADLNAIRA